MSRYTIRHEHLGAWPVVALVDSLTGMAVRITRRGATLLDFLVPVGGRLRNIVDAYPDAAALGAGHASRFAIMVPFANRVADARYRFAGREYDLLPGVTGAKRSIMHGFLRAADFDLLAMDADDDGATVRLGCDALRPEAFAGYPFAVDVEVAFTLHATGLDLAVTMRNTGDGVAPCFFGWHTYLKLRDDGIDELMLKLPSRKLIVTDTKLIPLPGQDAYARLDEHPEVDFRTARPIGGVVLDTGFADPVADADGRIRSTLSDPDSGLAVSMWQTSGITLVFTGDTLQGPARRRSVALEPMQSMTNAFNREDCADAISLAPGAERRFDAGLELHLP